MAKKYLEPGSGSVTQGEHNWFSPHCYLNMFGSLHFVISKSLAFLSEQDSSTAYKNIPFIEGYGLHVCMCLHMDAFAHVCIHEETGGQPQIPPLESQLPCV